jgi:hypothetical protein
MPRDTGQSRRQAGRTIRYAVADVAHLVEQMRAGEQLLTRARGG